MSPLEGYDPLPESREDRVAIYLRDPVEYCRRLDAADLKKLLAGLAKTEGLGADGEREALEGRWAEWREWRRAEFGRVDVSETDFLGEASDGEVGGGADE